MRNPKILRGLLEGKSPRSLLLANRGPRWTRTDLFNPKFWELVGYQSEIVLQADASSFTVMLAHPTKDSEELPEAQQLATKLSSGFNGVVRSSGGDLTISYDSVVDFISALNSVGRSPQPSDL